MANRTLGRVERGETYSGCTELTVMVCPYCGVLYAIPERLREHAAKYGGFKHMWCCPNGHELGYGNNVEDELQKQLDVERARAGRLAAARDQAQARAEAEKASARAERAAKTRFKNERDRDRRRVAHGVCPCCNRGFKQLSRHMASKHPEFVAEADAEVRGGGEA